MAQQSVGMVPSHSTSLFVQPDEQKGVLHLISRQKFVLASVLYTDSFIVERLSVHGTRSQLCGFCFVFAGRDSSVCPCGARTAGRGPLLPSQDRPLSPSPGAVLHRRGAESGDGPLRRLYLEA